MKPLSSLLQQCSKISKQLVSHTQTDEMVVQRRKKNKIKMFEIEEEISRKKIMISVAFYRSLFFNRRTATLCSVMQMYLGSGAEYICMYMVCSLRKKNIFKYFIALSFRVKKTTLSFL